MIHEFYKKLANILNTGKSHSVVLGGNIYDLFHLSVPTKKATVIGGNEVSSEIVNVDTFVPLIEFLSKKCVVKQDGKKRGVTMVIYEVNNEIKVVGDDKSLANAWRVFKGDNSEDNDFSKLCKQAKESPTAAMEFLRQLTICSRMTELTQDLLIVVEAADMILPIGDIAHLSMADRKRIAIVNDWFSDPDFTTGHDSVILLAESASLIHPIVSRLPQVLSVSIPLPNAEERGVFVKSAEKLSAETIKRLNFVETTAGLSLHAMRQLMCDGNDLQFSDIVDKVEAYLCSQLGDDVIEFKRVTHTLKDVRGFRKLKQFLEEELAPRFHAGTLSGMGVGGPIGAGKTFIFEAWAGVLGIPVLVLKNLRSQWFGQTDVIFERLKRALEALDKVCIIVDEADTAFGGVGQDTHETERRLTGKIQAMMSDKKLKGKVIWLLMTARIHALSADIRRPGRAGDLIVPVLDPEGEDALDFRKWIVEAIWPKDTPLPSGMYDHPEFVALTKGYSSASWQSLRDEVKSRKAQDINAVVAIVKDMLPADIKDVRRYQVLQALMNCTRRSLMPENDGVNAITDVDTSRTAWAKEIRELENRGVKC